MAAAFFPRKKIQEYMLIMKKLIFFIAALAASICAYADGAPAIEFAVQQHDFGTIAEKGGPVSHEFVFTNTGDAPLMIIKASASCGCTRPDYPKQPVKPGQKAKVKVTYLPEGRPGEFEKTITVKTNAKKKRTVTLRIKGFVTPAAK